MKLTVDPANRRDVCLSKLRAHIRDCQACQDVGGEDAARSLLCVRANALYELWERAISALAATANAARRR